MVDHNLNFENAMIIFRNFSGEERQFNPKGRRNFSIVLSEEVANALMDEGWNVKALRKRNEDDEQRYHLPVTVSFGNYPPKIVQISSSGKTFLDEESVGSLDFVELQSVDVTVRPYNYDVNGTRGTKAYLKTLYAVLSEDEFEQKYRDVGDRGCAFDDEDRLPF